MILYAMFTQNIIELFATAYDLQEILQLQFLSQTNQIQIFAWVSVDHHAFQVWRLAGDAQPFVVLEGAELLLGFGLVIEVTKKLAPSVGADLVDGAHQVVKDTFDGLIVELRRLDLLKDLYWLLTYLLIQGCGPMFECLTTFSGLLSSLFFQHECLSIRILLNLIGQEIISINIYLLLRGILRQAFRVVRNLQRWLLWAPHAHGAKIFRCVCLQVKGSSRRYSISALFLDEFVNAVSLCWFRKGLLRTSPSRLSRFHFVLFI